MATKADLRTLNDFKLLQLSWLYDMNFPVSLQMVHERRYVDKIVNVLPDKDAIREAVESVLDHVERKRAEG